MWLLLGCRPAAPTVAPPAPPADRVGSEPSGAALRSTPEPTAPTEPAAGLPHTCEIELELLAPSGAHGRGASTTNASDAKQAAWAQACEGLRKTASLDCHDDDHVGVILQRSSSMRSVQGDGVDRTRYEFELILGARRTAKGFGDAVGARKEACSRAKAHACEQLVGGPCPDDGVRVIAVDGEPPRPATVEPSAKNPPPRPTI